MLGAAGPLGGPITSGTGEGYEVCRGQRNRPKARPPAPSQDRHAKCQLPYRQIHTKNELFACILFTPHGQPCGGAYSSPLHSVLAHCGEGIRRCGTGGASIYRPRLLGWLGFDLVFLRT